MRAESPSRAGRARLQGHVREHAVDPDEWAPQTFCASAPGPSGEPWCTVEKTYTYETVGTVTKTHITEVWEGFGDPWFW